MASWKKVIVSGSSAELSALTLDTALTVPNGGTGASTFTNGGILFGNGTGAIQATSVLGNGQLLIGDGSGVPTLGTLTAGTGIDITNGSGTITIAGVDASTTQKGIVELATTAETTTGTDTTKAVTPDGLKDGYQGSTNVTTLGTIGTGVWQGTAIADTYVAEDLTISGGTVNNTVIGGSTPAAATFTSITMNSSGDIIGAGSDIRLTGADSALTGSFTGSFIGDGSGLSGVTATFPTTQKNLALAATDRFFYNDNSGANPSKFLELGTLAANFAGSGLAVEGGKALSVDSGSLVAYYSGSTFSTISGDITISSGGTAAIGSGVIVDADINASANIATSKLAANTISGKTLGNNLDNLTDGNGIANFTYNGSSAATVTVEADGSTLSVGASGVKVADAGITATQLNSSVAGTGLSGGAGTALSVDYGTSAGTAAQGNVGVTFAGTSNEIELTTNTFSTVGGGGSVTIGLPDDVTIGNDLTVVNDAVINGDLTVRGTASFEDTINLEVADRFILLASGSTSAGDGGIVIQQSAGKTGAVFAYDGASTARWGIDTAFNASASAYTPAAFMAAVIDEGAGQSDAAAYQKNGNIRVTSGGDIFIYS